MDFNLHGYHPNDILSGDRFHQILNQAWEMGEPSVLFIHGHGRNRGVSPGFVNTNTGFFGLRIRSALRHDKSLRQWIKYTTLDCRDPGATSVKLKLNPNPTRRELDAQLFPELTYDDPALSSRPSYMR
jgi:hypothetical protein